MTTIAITHEQVAADGLRTWGDEIRGLDFEKIKVVDRKIYCFSGYTALIDPLISWHRAGPDPEKLPQGVDYKEHSWTLVVVSEKGICKYTSTIPYPEWFDAPVAFGAGGDYAMGAMLHGATARDAVAIAASITNHTGGKIRSINIAEVTGATLRREVLKEAAE